jgi:antitoxin HicB
VPSACVRPRCSRQARTGVAPSTAALTTACGISPKVRKGQPSVTLPALVTAKVLLANEMIAQGVRKSELARRLDVHMPQVDRLLDLKHSSKLDAIESAFKQLGKTLEASIV